MVGQAIATAALPTLSRLWSEGRRDELDRLVRRTLEAGLGLGVLGAAATWALAGPLVALVYQRGAFAADDAARVAATLQVCAFAVPAWIAQQIAVRPSTPAPTPGGRCCSARCSPPRRSRSTARSRAYGARGSRGAGALAIGASALATLALARAAARRARGSARSRARRCARPRSVSRWPLAARAVQPGGAGALGALVDLASGGAAFLVAASAGALLASGAATRDAWLAPRARGPAPLRRRRTLSS